MKFSRPDFSCIIQKENRTLAKTHRFEFLQNFCLIKSSKLVDFGAKCIRSFGNICDFLQNFRSDYFCNDAPI
jgi:hypothetical protein